MVDSSDGEDVMTAEVMEIVELESGEVALRRVDESSEEPVISIRFSPRALEQFQPAHLEVARVMIAAGVQAIANARDRAVAQSQPPLIH